MARRGYSKNMPVIDALEASPLAKDVLESFGLPCWRCIVAEYETIEEGARACGIDPDAVIAKLERDAPMGGKAGATGKAEGRGK